MRTHLLNVQARGTIALPADLHRRLRLDREDAQVRLIESDDGRIVLEAVVVVHRLSPSERAIVRAALPAFNAACDRIAADPAAGWPAALRVKDVEGAPGIFEVTFNFSGTDIRATFEWTQLDGARAIRWRRIGGHAIFKRP